MYLTAQDLTEYGIILGKGKADAQALYDIIQDDLASDERKRAIEGTNYYQGFHDILDRKIYYFDSTGTKVVDETRANNRIVNPFHTILVDEKIGYILSNPIQFTVNDEKFQEVINAELGDWFTDICQKWLERASNEGVAFLHPYIDPETGKLEYTILDGFIIPFYETRYKQKLIGALRYYIVTEVIDGMNRDVIHAELYDENEVTFYTQYKGGTLSIDTSIENNPRGHFFWKNDDGSKEYQSWLKTPMIELANNNDKQTDLEKVKSLIDVYDLAASDFANNLEDIQNVVYNIKDFDGQDLREFITNIKTFKVIKTFGTGAVEPISFEIPVEAKEKFLQMVEKNIYIFGMGFNPNDEKFASNSSGVALKYKYYLLDTRANKLINKLKSSLKEFMYFLTQYINERDKQSFNYEDVQFTIKKSMIVNESELVDMAMKSKGIESTKTIVANHPWTKNTDEELKELESEIVPVNFPTEPVPPVNEIQQNDGPQE